MKIELLPRAPGDRGADEVGRFLQRQWISPKDVVRWEHVDRNLRDTACLKTLTVRAPDDLAGSR